MPVFASVPIGDAIDEEYISRDITVYESVRFSELRLGKPTSTRT